VSDEELMQLRRQVVMVLAELSGVADGVNTRAARNLHFHIEELLKAMDAVMSGTDPDGTDHAADE
jgi:hypothetical protein